VTHACMIVAVVSAHLYLSRKAAQGPEGRKYEGASYKIDAALEHLRQSKPHICLDSHIRVASTLTVTITIIYTHFMCMQAS
jgi:hypothetical protein